VLFICAFHTIGSISNYGALQFNYIRNLLNQVFFAFKPARYGIFSFTENDRVDETIALITNYLHEWHPDTISDKETESVDVLQTLTAPMIFITDQTMSLSQLKDMVEFYGITMPDIYSLEDGDAIFIFPTGEDRGILSVRNDAFKPADVYPMGSLTGDGD
jgi:hypothetical protein